MSARQHEKVRRKLGFLLDSEEMRSLQPVELEDVLGFFADGIRRRAQSHGNALTKHRERVSQITAEVARMPIKIPVFTEDHFLEKLKKTYPNKFISTPPEHVVCRMKINYLRHTCTSYDGELLYLPHYNSAYKEHFHASLKNRILDLIAEAYPDLQPYVVLQRSSLLDLTGSP